jgi:hypothetical protein
MAIDFPNSPSVNDTFTVGTRTWIWDGTTWELVATSSDPIQKTIVDAKGDLIAATNSDAVARLAVGTNGQVLTADSSASTGLAWANGKDFSLITTLSLSGVASASADSVFTSSYRNYFIMWSGNGAGVSAVAGVTLIMRASGSDVSLGNYNLQYLQANSSTVSGTRVASSTAFAFFDARQNQQMGACAYLYQPQIATATGYQSQAYDVGANGYTEPGIRIIYGNYSASTAFDGIKILIGGSNTLTGELSIYGLKD